MNCTCQDEIGVQVFESRQEELEKAWNDLLKEKREVEARAQFLDRQEQQFKIKWDMLITETQKLANDKKQFELRKNFFKQVETNLSAQEVRNDNVINCEGFFSGVSDAKSLKKRYKDLLKIYHPDAECGDNSVVLEINREYDNLKNIIV